MDPAGLRFCPRCGAGGYGYHDGKFWRCDSCGFRHYHNVAASASVIVEIGGRVLTVVRGKDPGKGLLSLPGGFIDPDERAEDAAVRECREEAGVDVTDLSFVGSWPNDYEYGSVLYKTCDLYFSARAAYVPRLEAHRPEAHGSGEVAGIELIDPEDIESAPIAFESARRALLAWRLRARGH